MNIETLRSLIAAGAMPADSITFAKSLVNCFDQRGSLSPKQAPWVDKLIERAAKPAPAVEQLDAKVAGVFRLFEKASDAGLKHPKIRLETEEGQYLVFARCGARSRYEGQVQITDGGPFGANKYFGRINEAGQLQAGRDMNGDVQATVKALATDPARTAAVYGKRTGECCFCGLGLTDGRSVLVGYGPVCADRYGMPWGERGDTAITLTLDESEAVAA